MFNKLLMLFNICMMRKLMHRDVKPENMLIGQNHEIVLSDFGLVAPIHRPESPITLENIGTIDSIPKEQSNGYPQAASDQYALAVTVYEWLSGTRPFTGKVWMDIALQQTPCRRRWLLRPRYTCLVKKRT